MQEFVRTKTPRLQPHVPVDVLLELFNPLGILTVAFEVERHLLHAPVVIRQVHGVRGNTLLQKNDLIALGIPERYSVRLADFPRLHIFHN